jgi:hypothetical protein
MGSDPYPTFIFAGPNKSGSTWVHAALDEHPDVFMPERGPMNYFDINYYRGEQWYTEQYAEYTKEAAIGDESPGYIKHPYAPERIAKDVPDADIIFCFRNPIKRAFSHWWNEERKWTDTLPKGGLEYVLNDHSSCDVFITPGHYKYHLERWDDHFDEGQLKLTFFDDFVADNEAYIQDIYDFIGVDPEFVPSVVDSSINEGKTKIKEPPTLRRFRLKIVRTISATAPDQITEDVLRPLYRTFHEQYTTAIDAMQKNPYEQGLDPDIQRRLEQIYRDDIIALQDRTGRDLSHWVEYVDI